MKIIVRHIYIACYILIIGLIILGTINAFQVNKVLASPIKLYNNTQPTFNSDSTSHISNDILLQEELRKIEGKRKVLFDSNTITYLITLIITLVITLGVAFLSRASSLLDKIENKLNSIETTIASNEIEDIIVSSSEGIYFMTLILYSAYISNSTNKEKLNFTYSICHRLQRLIDRMKSNINNINHIDRQNKEIIVNYLSDSIIVHHDINKNNQTIYKGDYIENIIEQIENIHTVVFELEETDCIKEKSKFRLFWRKKAAKF